jgi:hypothetical protein
MGLDVVLAVRDVTWDADHYLTPRLCQLISTSSEYVRYEPEVEADHIAGTPSSGPVWMTFGALERYYGPGYERGSWPDINGAIRMLRVIYPDREIRYGSDSGMGDFRGLMNATDRFLDEMWKHWLSENGERYYRL